MSWAICHSRPLAAPCGGGQTLPRTLCYSASIHLISQLYEKTALIITTNLSFAEWVTVFGDAKMPVLDLRDRPVVRSSHATVQVC